MAAVRVTVDTRPGENGLFDLLRDMLQDEPSLLLDRATLDLGDVRVTSESCVVLLERKTWSDLCASLRDGRYVNQKARLLAERERGNAALVYLIEGSPPPDLGSTHGVPNSSAYAALTKMAVRDGIASIWSSCTRDTARRVVYMARTCAKGGFDAEAKAQAAGGYASFVKHTSKRKNCEDNQFSVMLATVPGVSARVAVEVAKRFPTARLLVQALDRGRAECVAEISKICMGKRRLGPTMGEKICNLFS